MRLDGLTGWSPGSGARSLGRRNNTQGVEGPICEDCEKPQPLQIENPGNPSSWYKGITNLLSGSQKWMACIQKKLTEGILDPNSSDDPNLLRQSMFQASALIGKMYDLFNIAIDTAKQNKLAAKDTQSLALAAK